MERLLLTTPSGESRLASGRCGKMLSWASATTRSGGTVPSATISDGAASLPAAPLDETRTENNGSAVVAGAKKVW